MASLHLSSAAAEMLAAAKELVNQQFHSPEFERLLEVRFTPDRARLWMIHMPHYVVNRRNCWGYVQGSSPLSVKQWIWEHESEELIRDPRADMNHFALQLQEAAVVGVSEEDVTQAELIPGTRAAFWAWQHLARHSSWLYALAASSILEYRNSGAVVQAGGLSFRMRQKLIQDLGLTAEQLQSSSVHVEADMDHGTLLERVAETYVHDAREAEQMMDGIRDSLTVDRAYRGAMADALAHIA